MKKVFAWFCFCALFAGLALPTLAQFPGLLQPGQILGNPSSSSGLEPASPQSPSAFNIITAVTNDVVYYVRPDGSDNCTGLTNAAGSSGACAFATWNHAIAVGQQLNGGGHRLTIQEGKTGSANTYTAGISCVGGFFNFASVSLVGNTSTPANEVISTTSLDAINVADYCNIGVSGFTLQTATGGNGLHAQIYSVISINSGMVFGAVAAHQIGVGQYGQVEVNTAYTINGGAQDHVFIDEHALYRTNGNGITLTGTPSFSVAFAIIVDRSSLANFSGTTFTGSTAASVTRFACNGGQIITSTSGNLNYLPGDTAGTFAETCLYDNAFQYPYLNQANVWTANNLFGFGNLWAAGTDQAVSSGQISFGGTITAAGSGTCPSGTVGGQTVQGCFGIHVGSTQRQVPFF